MLRAAEEQGSGFERKKSDRSAGDLPPQERTQATPGDRVVREHLLRKIKIPLKTKKAYGEVLAELERFNDVLTHSNIPIRFRNWMEPDPPARQENEHFSSKYKIDEKALPQAYVVFIGLEKSGSKVLDWGVKIFLTPMEVCRQELGDFTVRTQNGPDQPEIFRRNTNKEGLIEDITDCFEKVMSQYAKTMKWSAEETARKWKLFSVNLKRWHPTRAASNDPDPPKNTKNEIAQIDL